MQLKLNTLTNFYHQLPKYNHTEVDDSWYRQTLYLHLYYQPPYAFETLLQFLDRRAIPGVETVCEDTYYRTALLRSASHTFKGWIAVTQDGEPNALALTFSASLYPVLIQVIERIRHLFDLDYPPEASKEVLNDSWMDSSTRMPGGFDGFEVSVRTVLGQQITVQAATTLAGRLVHALGTPFVLDLPGLSAFFPSAETLIAAGKANSLEGGKGISDVLGPLGITGRRASTIEAIAQATVSGEIQLKPYPIWKDKQIDTEVMTQIETEMKRLLAIKGVGPWTAHAIGMRALGYPDAFLESDIGVIKAMKALYPDSEEAETSKGRLALAEAWRPMRSYAVMNLWK
ncbi:DNA-3-methyladenine glycosylase family protein [Staphylococcus simulans]|uniref:DNA-3-methyladenine glycosylase family protein n=1 Tax=Staphylococcus simulans TaxID=1286 RepID=UPI0013049FCA|nr:AlkA N-terminal domain-containing protein [Staphylococcus simulans]MDY5060221.1 AlkA N-terminal domain-containing protein [Staphylococcus simulans]